MAEAGLSSLVGSLSLAAPAYNEAHVIEQVVRDWIAYLQAQESLRWEIVICNDGSRDETGAILDRLAAEYPALRPIYRAVNQGAAAALTTAIHNTTSEWVLLIDADGQFPVENLSRLAAELPRGALAVLGKRTKKDSWFARFGSWGSGIACNLAHGTSLKDFNSAFKLVRGDVIRALPLEARGLNYSTEITSKLLERGVEIHEVAIEHLPRPTGKSSRKLVRDAGHRALFVLYILVRQYLLRSHVLVVPTVVTKC
jgi:glycosyltransferase involved in cell wall biosynthesis